MALRQKYVEYHTFNVNTLSDLITLKEELQKLVNNNFTLSVTVNAYNCIGDRGCSSVYNYTPWRCYPEDCTKSEETKLE